MVRFRALDGREITAVAPAASRRSFVAATTVSIRSDPVDRTRIQILSGQNSSPGG